MPVERLDATYAAGENAWDVDITGKSTRFRCLWKSFDDSFAENAEEAAGLKAQHG